jgi:RHS repeat-associated protein
LISANGRYGDLSFEYDATGNRLRFTQGRSTTTYHYAIDSHQLLASLGSHPETRTYNAVGNTLQSAIGRYRYDDTNRPVQYTRAGVVAEYAYNGKGERVSKTVNGRTTHFRYGPNGQLLGEYADDGKPLREYIYLEGQPLALLSFSAADTPEPPQQTHSRQMRGRIKPRREVSGMQKHGWMPVDRCDSGHQGPSVSRTPATPSSRWRGRVERSKALSKQDRHRSPGAGIGNRSKRWLKGDGKNPLINQSTTTPSLLNSRLAYLHTDHLGAVVKATDDNQNLVWDAVRRPFGSRSLITAQIEMPLGFPGQYYDEESGVYYNYFRTYDPSMGRYLESDPIGLEGGLNIYTYVRGNPINRIDPEGLKDGCSTGMAPDANGICHPTTWRDPPCVSSDCAFYSPTTNCSCTLDCMAKGASYDIKIVCGLLPSLASDMCEEQAMYTKCTYQCAAECNRCTP